MLDFAHQLYRRFYHRERYGFLFIPNEDDGWGLACEWVVEVAKLHSREALHLPLQVPLGLRHGHVAVRVHIAGIVIHLV